MIMLRLPSSSSKLRYANNRYVVVFIIASLVVFLLSCSSNSRSSSSFFFVSANDEDQTCDNPDTCNDFQFEKPGKNAKYVTDGAYFPSNQFLSVPVTKIRHDTMQTKIITFALPPDTKLGIAISSAILMNVPKNDGSKKFVQRPYNPIHFDDKKHKDSFEILVKIYDGGMAGEYVSQLKVGDLVQFKQTKANVKKFQYPFEGVTKITMLAGGTGIAPMYQALVPLLENKQSNNIEIRLLYGNKTPGDIILQMELEKLSRLNQGRFSYLHVIGEEQGERMQPIVVDTNYAESGWIDHDKISRHGFSPNSKKDGNKHVVWMCGVDDMYNSLAGSRLKKLAKDSPLYKLGYRDDTVWRS